MEATLEKDESRTGATAALLSGCHRGGRRKRQDRKRHDKPEREGQWTFYDARVTRGTATFGDITTFLALSFWPHCPSSFPWASVACTLMHINNVVAVTVMSSRDGEAKINCQASSRMQKQERWRRTQRPRQDGSWITSLKHFKKTRGRDELCRQYSRRPMLEERT